MSESPIPEMRSPPGSALTPVSIPQDDFEASCLHIRRQWEAGTLPFKEAAAQLTALRQQAREADRIADQASVERMLGFMQLNRGNLNTSLRHYEQAKALFLQVGNRRYGAAMDMNMGEVYRYKGDFNRARQLYRQAAEVARETGFLTIQTLALANEGQVLLTMGQHDSARVALEEAHRLSQQWTEDFSYLPGLLSEVHHALAMICLARSEPQIAWRHAREALETAQESQQPLGLGFANRAIAEVLTALGKPPDSGFSDDPDGYYQASTEAFKEINAEAEMARTMYAQAWSQAKRGLKSAAGRKFQQVMVIFTKLGMVDDAARAAEAQLRML